MQASSVVRSAFVAGLVLVATPERALSQASSQPQAEPDIRKEMKQDVDELRAVRLTVKKVDKAQHKVLFEAQVSPEASFKSGQGTPIKLDQLKEGDEVRAAFDPKTGEVMGVKILTAEEKAKAAKQSK